MRTGHGSLAIIPLPNRLHLFPAFAVGALLLIAAVLVPAHPASAQRGGDPSCSTAGAVSDAANNPGLVSDCETLLAARDILVGTASLNWSVSTPIDLWEGITVAGSPPRVYGLKLAGKELTGEIPPGLGSLSNLEELILIENHLTGRIPTELGGLANLILLNLYGNQLSGEIPTELATLSNLRELSLSSNQLTGQIPTALGGLSNLLVLYLYDNQLTGPIPRELGSLGNLIKLTRPVERFRPNWATSQT